MNDQHEAEILHNWHIPSKFHSDPYQETLRQIRDSCPYSLGQFFSWPSKSPGGAKSRTDTRHRADDKFSQSKTRTRCFHRKPEPISNQGNRPHCCPGARECAQRLGNRERQLCIRLSQSCCTSGKLMSWHSELGAVSEQTTNTLHMELEAADSAARTFVK